VAVPEESKDPNPVLPKSPAPKSVAPSAKSESLKPEADVATAPIAERASAQDAKPEAATAADAASPAAAKPTAPAAKPVPAKPEAPKPQPWDSGIIRKLKAHYGSGIKEASTYVGQNYLVVDSSIAYEILLRMHDDELFDYCVDITAVHYPKREAQFDLLYILYSFHSNERIRVKMQIKDGERVQSATAIWPTANWLEREVYDMFGIGFEGHPELKRILLPDGWTGHPLRKDYPILQQDQEWVKANVGIESGQ
jgi:NADH-quinone oxidoreductase subunit C